MEKTVSIIITCYNYGRFLGQAIESALAQTSPIEEIIVANDGSTDNTNEVVCDYQDKITYLNHENFGLIKNVYDAISQVKSTYFVVLSADDVLDQHYVSILMSELLVSGADFAYSDMRLIGVKEGVQKSMPFNRYSLLRANYINGSALMKTSDFLENGGFSQLMEDLGYEDWDFWLSMVEKEKKGIYVPMALLNYRQHESGSRNQVGTEQLSKTVRQLRKNHPYLFSHKNIVRDILRLLAEKLITIGEVIHQFLDKQVTPE